MSYLEVVFAAGSEFDSGKPRATIYNKLVDTEHEYTFDEIGEGFINLLFELHTNVKTIIWLKMKTI